MGDKCIHVYGIKAVPLGSCDADIKYFTSLEKIDIKDSEIELFDYCPYCGKDLKNEVGEEIDKEFGVING